MLIIMIHLIHTAFLEQSYKVIQVGGPDVAMLATKHLYCLDIVHKLSNSLVRNKNVVLMMKSFQSECAVVVKC